MKVITLWQPWASLIALGWKTIETRTHNRFQNLIGETIGIHAGNKWDNDWSELAEGYLTQQQVLYIGQSVYEDFELGRTKGKILCTTYVDAAGWLSDEIDSKDALICCEPNKVGFDRFGLFLHNIKLIHPISAKGKQGIWNYDGEIVYL